VNVVTATRRSSARISAQGGESAATSKRRARKPTLARIIIAHPRPSLRPARIPLASFTRNARMAAAAADTVAPLLRLERATWQAFELARFARALELSERALAAAEATLPGDSLVLAQLLHTVSRCRTHYTDDVLAAAQTPGCVDALRAAWARDEQALALSQRCLALLHARWRAGTLFSLTPEEAAFFGEHGLKMPCPGTEPYIQCSNDACLWPALRTPAEAEARLRGVHGALCVALDLQRQRGYVAQSTLDALHNLLMFSLLGPPHGLLHQLRSVCGLTPADEIALRELQQHNDALCRGAGMVSAADGLAALQERGAADVAHYGLRRCALPVCGNTEPHPKLFKLCGRCRGAAYCCAGHSKEDWKRHKREDGCKAASS
jgi:hypothetical protein